MPRYSLITILLLIISPYISAQPPIQSYFARFHPITAQHAMVSAQESIAAQIGLDALKNSDNAVDAAVSIGFALAVTLPRAGNLAGGALCCYI